MRLHVLASPAPEGAAPRVVCTRCRDFLPAGSTGRECMGCREGQGAAQRGEALYPTWYIILFGIFTTFTVAGVLAALNWRALGDRARERRAWCVAAVGLLVTAAILLSGVPLAFLIGLGPAGILAAIHELGPVYEAHHESGGRDANLFEPTGLLVPALVLVVLVVALAGPTELPVH